MLTDPGVIALYRYYYYYTLTYHTYRFCFSGKLFCFRYYYRY